MFYEKNEYKALKMKTSRDSLLACISTSSMSCTDTCTESRSSARAEVQIHRANNPTIAVRLVLLTRQLMNKPKNRQVPFLESTGRKIHSHGLAGLLTRSARRPSR